MSAEGPDPPEESHWATEWSSRRLTADEKNVFEDLIADLYDWVALSVDSCSVAVQEHCRSLPLVIRKERTREYYASMIRYVLVELVICCESDEKNTVNDKMKKLVNFFGYLVHDVTVVEVELIDQEFANVCQDAEAYPHPPPDDDAESDAHKLSLSMFTNFHVFATRMYSNKLITTTQPGKRVIEACFGDTVSHSDDVFFATAQWLTCAHEAIYNSNPEYKNHWATWYKEICVRTAEYGRKTGVEARRLNIAGRTAQKGMEKMDINLMAFDQAIREGINDSARLETKRAGTMAENAMLVDQTIKVLEATFPKEDSKRKRV